MAVESFAKGTQPRSHILGGSEARIIVRADEAARIQLWTDNYSGARAAKPPTAPAQFLRPVRGKYSRASHSQRQTAANSTTFMTSIRAFMKAYAILWQKLCACFSERTFDQGDRVLVSRVATHLDVRDRVSMKTDCFRQVPNRPIQLNTRPSEFEHLPSARIANVTCDK